jgi:hypothetical protein
MLKVNAVHSDDERFAYWAYQLNLTLGRPELDAPTANPMQPMSWGQSAKAIQRMAEAVHRLSEKHAAGTDQSQPAGTGIKADNAHFSIYKLTALMRWCGIVRESEVPPIWPLLLGSTEVEDHRLNIMKGMRQFYRHRNVEFDEGVFLREKTVKAKPWQGYPIFQVGGKSLSILACRPNTALEIELERTREQAKKDTRKTRSLGKALQLEAGDMRAQEDNFHDLPLNIGMFAGLLEVLYGEKCDCFRCVFDVYQVMTHPAVSATKGKFTPLLCRQITWAIHDDKSSFFHQRLHPDNFKGASMPMFPTSLLDDIIPNARFQNGIHRSTFPEAWVPKPAGPPLTSPPMPKGPNHFQLGGSRGGTPGQGRDWYAQLGHMHSWI